MTGPLVRAVQLYISGGKVAVLPGACESIAWPDIDSVSVSIASSDSNFACMLIEKKL